MLRANRTAVTTALKSFICTFGFLPLKMRHIASNARAETVAIRMLRRMPIPKNQHDNKMPGDKQKSRIAIKRLTDRALVCRGEVIAKRVMFETFQLRLVLLEFFSGQIQFFVF